MIKNGIKKLLGKKIAEEVFNNLGEELQKRIKIDDVTKILELIDKEEIGTEILKNKEDLFAKADISKIKEILNGLNLEELEKNLSGFKLNEFNQIGDNINKNIKKLAETIDNC